MIGPGTGVRVYLACGVTPMRKGIAELAYLADILDRIHDHKINRLDELPPWNWSPVAVSMACQAA